MAGIQRRIDNSTDERKVASDILIDEASRVFDRELCRFLEKPLLVRSTRLPTSRAAITYEARHRNQQCPRSLGNTLFRFRILLFPVWVLGSMSVTRVTSK